MTLQSTVKVRDFLIFTDESGTTWTGSTTTPTSLLLQNQQPQRQPPQQLQPQRRPQQQPQRQKIRPSLVAGKFRKTIKQTIHFFSVM